MRFQEKLNESSKQEIWDEYCGFLDLTMNEYMTIQKRLLLEQIGLWSASKLGQKFLKERKIDTIEDFRKTIPITTYRDYSDILLQKNKDMLPADPVLWIQTTWEGGLNPIKVAPYTKSMLETYKKNMMACFLLATSEKKGDFDVSAKDHILYALAPLPYATGILPVLLKEEIDIQFLPPVEEAQHLSFSERNKKGFKMGLKQGIEFFFGLGSVTYYVSKSFSSLSSGGKKGGSLKQTLTGVSLDRLIKYVKTQKECKRDGTTMAPKDLFRLKGFMCAGTDNQYYKDDLEELWGIRPMELFAGTEPTVIGTETWTRSGMYFFPDACFYEFIPEEEMEKSLADATYQPQTLLMDEVAPGEKYEIVLTVLKGGAFARYRVGDMYRCVGKTNKEDETRIPRFQYVDRIPTIIDIAGFTRITEKTIATAMDLSGLNIQDWVARKEYLDEKRPLLHIFVEMHKDSMITTAMSQQIIKEHLSIYFRYLDHDYKDLKIILGMDPMKITLVKHGTFNQFESEDAPFSRRVNPPLSEMNHFLRVVSGIREDRRF